MAAERMGTHVGALIVKDDRGRYWEVPVVFAPNAILHGGLDTRPTARVLPKGEIVQWRADLR